MGSGMQTTAHPAVMCGVVWRHVHARLDSIGDVEAPKSPTKAGCTYFMPPYTACLVSYTIIDTEPRCRIGTTSGPRCALH